MNPLVKIREKSREEWLSCAKEKWTEVRIWIQENGELAGIVLLLAGLFIGQALRFFFSLAVLAAVVFFAAYLYAQPEASRARSEKTGDSDDSSNDHSIN